MGAERKTDRLFIGLPLNGKQIISHVRPSQFRADLTFPQLINITTYILHLFLESGILGNRVIHCTDSTELTVGNQELLAAPETKGRKIRICDDTDCDCGNRRKKRNKSVYVIGYRMHTLTVVNAGNGHSYPLISLLAPANHHDSSFHESLVQLGKTVGLKTELTSADEACTGSGGSFSEKNGVHLITPPKSEVKVPADTDSVSGPLNLLKNREGPETVRVRSQHGPAARCTFATMATLLSEITGTRKKKRPVRKKVRQIPLPCAA